MTKRRVFIILGIVLIALGSWGVIYSQLELSRQQEALKAKTAEEGRIAEEERAKAEELSRLAELEKQKNIELELKRAEEERLREEAAFRRAETEAAMRRKSAQAPELRGGSKASEAQPDRTDRTAVDRSQRRPTGGEPSGRAQRPTVIRFTFELKRDREVSIAHVHVGDLVTVRYQGLEGTEPPLYVGLAPVGMAATSSRQPNQTDFGRTRTAIATRVIDNDQFRISVPPKLDRSSAKIMESRAGAALRVSTGFGSMRRSSSGAYEVEIEIETGNPWNIQPRSLLR
jgi:hypothetical protein